MTEANTYEQAQADSIENFIKVNGENHGEEYSEQVKEIAALIIKDLANGVYNIDWVSMDEFTSWFDEVARDDYEVLEDLPYRETKVVMGLVSDYINIEYSEFMITEDEYYPEDEEILTEDDLDNIL